MEKLERLRQSTDKGEQLSKIDLSNCNLGNDEFPIEDILKHKDTL